MTDDSDDGTVHIASDHDPFFSIHVVPSKDNTVIVSVCTVYGRIGSPMSWDDITYLRDGLTAMLAAKTD